MTMKTASEILSLGADGGGEVNLVPGNTVVVTGPNGAGKSAFIASLGNDDEKIEKFFGFRRINFSDSSVDYVGQAIPEFLNSLAQNNSRVANYFDDTHFKSVVKRIQDRQAQSLNDAWRSVREGASPEDAEANHPLPVNQINAVFEAARLNRRVILHDGSLWADNQGDLYPIRYMSDGERAALLLVGAILVQRPGKYLFVDEPEKHLNPSISGPLITSAIRLRPDLGYIFATHALQLIEWLRPDAIIHLSDYKADPQRFAYAVLGKGDGISEELRYAIMGSRKAVLLVEGTATSDDRALYAAVYPQWNVLPRGGWDSVSASVTAISDAGDYHWLTVAGIIDGDGRSPEEVEKLRSKSIFALPSPTIENLFLLEPIVREMVEQIASSDGGPPVAERLDAMVMRVKGQIEADKTDIILRRVLWAGNRELQANKPTMSSLKEGMREIPAIDLQEIEKRFADQLDEALKGDVFELLQAIPIKNSPIPHAVATTLGFKNFDRYRAATLAHIQRKTPQGERMLAHIKSLLPELPDIPS